MLTVNRKPVEIFKFPAGEVNVRVPVFLNAGEVRITSLLKNSDDIMALLLTVDAVRRRTPEIKIRLILPYFPYGRQDRVCNEGEALSISVMAGLINSLKCDSVCIFDPHSDVTSALINNCMVVSIENIFIELETKIEFKFITFVCPDSGMEKKMQRVLTYTETWPDEIIRAVKHRNLHTGKIERIELLNTDYIFERNLLIIDDICDGGATFIELAKLIRSHIPASLSLYVTHGIFSKGLDELFKYFDNIYCYYTFLENPPEKLTIIGDILNAC